ncbi:MAG: hypothetical protein IH800_05625 [Myxococcales bacterium]|nr:hypothetical protein [Myxococcales bacterium]MCZ6713002.1 hypothetical protein [Deltaproteobacteria bacterium]MCZ6822667.1 hypothetical protein [Deltaproteobacteria bacterium]
MSEQAGQLQPSQGSSAAIPEGDLLGVLSVRVESLVERFRKAQRRIAELDAQVAERDSSIAELVCVQEASKRGRNDASKRVERLLAQVERLERDGG